MKKFLRPLALMLVLVLMFSMSVIAADGDPTVTTTDANATAEFNGTNFESLTVTYQGTAGMTYMCWLLAMDENGNIVLPTESNVDTVVLDIKDAVADPTGKATFPNVLPKTESMVSCAIAISGMGGMSLVKVGEINVPYTVGDVDLDGDITAADAVMLNQYLAGMDGSDLTGANYMAADMDGDGDITAADAVALNQYLAN